MSCVRLASLLYFLCRCKKTIYLKERARTKKSYIVKKQNHPQMYHQSTNSNSSTSRTIPYIHSLRPLIPIPHLRPTLNTNNNSIAQLNNREVHIPRSPTNRRNKLPPARILEDLAGSVSVAHNACAGRAHVVAEPEGALDGDGAAVAGDFGLHGSVNGVVGEDDAGYEGLWRVNIGGGEKWKMKVPGGFQCRLWKPREERVRRRRRRRRGW
jgi:hypothetical protein